MSSVLIRRVNASRCLLLCLKEESLPACFGVGVSRWHPPHVSSHCWVLSDVLRNALISVAWIGMEKDGLKVIRRYPKMMNVQVCVFLIVLDVIWSSDCMKSRYMLEVDYYSILKKIFGSRCFYFVQQLGKIKWSKFNKNFFQCGLLSVKTPPVALAYT